MTAVNGL